MPLRPCLIPLLVAGSSLCAVQPPKTAPPDETLPKHTPAFADRVTELRREAARLSAGFPEGTGAAVDRTLRYLARQQNNDGSWGDHQKITTTSLALLAFLGNHVTPLSETDGEGVSGAMLFLIKASQQGKGVLADRLAQHDPIDGPLQHALATQALAESLLTCTPEGVSLPNLQAAVQNAAQWISDQAHRDGGWAFSFNPGGAPGSNLGMTIPSLHALWLAHLTSIETRNAPRAVRRSLEFVESLQKESGAFRFGAGVELRGDPMTGGSAFVHRIARRENHVTTRKAIEFLSGASYLPFSYQRTSDIFQLLSFHYDALAIDDFQDQNWAAWHEEAIPDLIRHQGADGSFPQLGTHPVEFPKDDLIQRSSLACLILQSPWRYHLKK